MPQCIKIKKKKRTVCVGDLRDEITIQSRAITAPAADGVNFSETFTGLATVWAAINSVNGKTAFDNTGTEFDVTHDIYIRYLTGVTAEAWVLFGSERYDIINVEDLDNRGTFMLLKCTNRGTTANVANEL